MLLGIDVSHHTGSRDWRGLADTGIKSAFVEATEATTAPPIGRAGFPQDCPHAQGCPPNNVAEPAAPRRVVAESQEAALTPNKTKHLFFTSLAGRSTKEFGLKESRGIAPMTLPSPALNRPPSSSGGFHVEFSAVGIFEPCPS